VSLGSGYLIVAFGSGAGPPAVSGVPSSKQKFRERSVYVRLQVGQRFILGYAESLVICHLTFIICHFVWTPKVFKIKNDKCQMIYDQ